MRKLILLLIAIAEGILLSLLFPDILDIFIIPFVVLLPSYFIIKYTKTYKGAFFLGWIVGFTTYFLGYNWLIYTIETFGGPTLPDWSVYPIFIFYCLFFSIKFPLAHLFAKFISKKIYRLPIAIIFPVVLTSIEFLIPELFPFYIGNFFYKNNIVMQIAEFTSLAGLTFISAFSSGVIYSIIFYFIPYIRKTPKMNRFPYLLVFSLFLLIAFCYIFGYLRINEIEQIQNSAERLKIGFIQPNTAMPLENFADSPLYPDRNEGESRRDYFNRKSIELSLEVLRENPNVDIIVWPEAGATFNFSNPRNAYEIKFAETIKKIAIEYGVYFFVNNLEFENTEERERGYFVYNNSDLISTDGTILDSYQKIFLLPFGEYNPIKDSFIDKLFPFLTDAIDNSGISEFERGKEIKLLEIGKWRFAPQVCYEIIIPQFTQLFTQLNPDFIINTTNDRWFGITKASEQHLLLASVRSIENRLYNLRVTNSGISTLFSATGENVSFISKNGDKTYFSPIFEQDYMIAEVKLLNIDSFYKQYGDVFSWIITIIFLLFIVIVLLRVIFNKIIFIYNIKKAKDFNKIKI